MSFGYDRLKQSGEVGARKKSGNKWFETQDSISYWEDFYRQKIVYPDIMRMPRQKALLNEYPYFYLDEANYYIEATNFIMTGKDIDLIYLFLTSDLGFFAFSRFYSGPQFDSTGFRYKKAYLDETIIPKMNDQEPKILQLRKLMKENKDLSPINDIINGIWSEIIGLNEEEIQFISRYKINLLAAELNNNDNKGVAQST